MCDDRQGKQTSKKAHVYNISGPKRHPSSSSRPGLACCNSSIPFTRWHKQHPAHIIVRISQTGDKMELGTEDGCQPCFC